MQVISDFKGQNFIFIESKENEYICTTRNLEEYARERNKEIALRVTRKEVTDFMQSFLNDGNYRLKID